MTTPPTIPYIFDYTSWVLTFPEFQGIAKPAAEMYFAVATGYVRNDGAGPVCDPQVQATLLKLTTAHIAKLFSTTDNGQPTTGGLDSPAGIVGRVSSATEGSVSVTSEFPDQPAAAAWWNQTIYGAAAWKLLAPTRTMRYLPGRRRVYNPPFFRGGFGGSFGGL